MIEGSDSEDEEDPYAASDDENYIPQTHQVPHGSRGATPIVGSCYICRDQKWKQRETRKSCVVCHEHSVSKTTCITCENE